jgi:hypothetical protein
MYDIVTSNTLDGYSSLPIDQSVGVSGGGQDCSVNRVANTTFPGSDNCLGKLLTRLIRYG